MEIRVAATKSELESVYKLRYKVYVEQEQKFGGINFHGNRMKDEFDEQEGTINLMMIVNGEVIGTVRATKAQTALEKLPSDKLFDFDAVRREHHGQIPPSIGMLAICKSYQNKNTFMALMAFLGNTLLKLNSDYIIFTLNHECTRLVSRTSRARILSQKIWSEEVQNFIIPMILYKDQLLDFLENVKQRNIGAVN